MTLKVVTLVTFWAEVLFTAVHIINLSPSSPLGYKILQELWSRKTLDYGDYGSLDVRHMHLCQSLNARSSSHGHGSASSLATD